ncbi:hypothetical protein OpiT1DRAFT_03841 [Opitutaceae bacterium TAV1]|nr:hypothetical protein OpiT1DRAFT_03841 [Opitutaceae bacterium TAV1]
MITAALIFTLCTWLQADAKAIRRFLAIVIVVMAFIGAFGLDLVAGILIRLLLR